MTEIINPPNSAVYFCHHQNDMYMKKLLIIAGLSLPLCFAACQGGNNTDTKSSDAATTTSSQTGAAETSSDYDPTRGEGKFDASNVVIDGFDAALAEKGKGIAATKCLSCHKPTDEKLVGPGWKGVTTRKTAHWIMNFVTNPDPMIDKDPEVQAQLEICLVRMPNQNITDDEARAVLEYMRQIDGAK